MAINLTGPVFTDETKAREHLEEIRWPNGPYCPHCGATDRIYRLNGASHRPGLIHCNNCEGSFTVTTGTVMESSHLPLNKWVLAYRLMASSKKGMSAHQLHRSIGVTYKTAWILWHRIREAMRDVSPGSLGGEGKTVEADETYVGGKPRKETGAPKAKRGRGTKKTPVAALVERNGRVRARKHISKEHLDRYVDEFSFRWNHRSLDDTERAVEIVKGGVGKRLTYKRPGGTKSAAP
jgi:transposase-like protein